MTEQERTVCKQSIVDAKEALKCSDMSAMQKRKATDELRRVSD